MQIKVLLKAYLVLILFFLALKGYTSFAAPIKLFYITNDTTNYSCEEVRQLYANGGLKEEVLNFNIAHRSKSAWFVVNLDSTEESRVLVIDNAHLDSIELYYYAGNDLIKFRCSGDHTDFSTRDFDNIYFSFIIPPRTNQLFIKAATQGPMMVPVKVQTYQEYFGWRGISIIHGIYFALIFFSILSNFLLYIWLREKFYAYYLLSLLSMCFITSVDLGYTFQYLWPRYPIINEYNHLFYYFFIFPVLFLEITFDTRKQFPLLHKGFLGVYLFTFCAVCISIFSPYSFSIRIIFYFISLIAFFSLLCSLYFYVAHKQLYSKLLAAGMIIYFAASGIYILAIGDLIENSEFSNNVIQMASCIQIIFITLASLSKLKILKKENEQLLIEQNKILERRVEERTIELNQKNDEIISQKKSIEEKNRTLKSQQENLEKLIEERTEELRLTNTELIDKNNRLEQFAFVTAHNLRGPVATILGLFQIFNKDSIKDDYNLGLVNNMEEITQKLDGIIKDLSVLLDLERNIRSLNEPVALKETLEEVKILLHNEIKESGAVITDNFTEEEKVETVPSYLNNIFYNLISNSIKFRRYNTVPEIKISKEANNSLYSIVFHDNGMGIDLAKYGNNLGSPYKRFHPDVKGKGLGLFITKRQIEAMNGRIEIESKPNMGTSIKVTLKTA